MGVLLYQAAIFIIIIFSGYSSKKSLNTATIIIVVFTLFHVFVPWLMVLQFVTIGVSYVVARGLTIRNKEQKESIYKYNKSSVKKDESFWFSRVLGVMILIGVLLGIIYSIISLIGIFTGLYDPLDWF